MNPRDLFGVGLRLLGIWFLSDAVYRGVYLFLKIQNLYNSTTISGTADKFLIGVNFLAAMILLKGANQIVRLCYGPDKN